MNRDDIQNGIKEVFWKKYKESDELGRRNLLAQLHMFKNPLKEALAFQDKPDLYTHYLINMFQSYIDDLIGVEVSK